MEIVLFSWIFALAIVVWAWIKHLLKRNK